MDKAAIRALRDLLLIIYDEQKSDWSEETQTGRKPSPKAKRFYDIYCYNKWQLIQRPRLEKWFNESGDHLEIAFSSEKAVLFLPPLTKDAEFVPILNLKCEFSETINSIRLYLLLVRLDQEDQKPYGLGFRFESPENEHYENQSGPEGLHDFYHAQFITGFGYGPRIEIPDWLPDSQPSFPLLADDPVTLVLALLMTLYGKRYCWDLYNKHIDKLPGLKEPIKRLHPFVKWRAMQT